MNNFKSRLLTFTGIAVASVAVFSFPAFAETYNMSGTVIAVTPNYRNVSSPVTVQDCYDVEVPVYGTRQRSGNAAEGAFLGMLLGGIAGKGLTGDDKGAAAGAIMGGVIGADKGAKPKNETVVIGHRTERQCDNKTVYENRRQLSDYTVSYEVLGVTQQANVSRKYQIGDSIPVRINIGLR